MSEAFPYSFGKYRMDAEIGRGGFGTVFRAEDVDLGRTVAIKVLDPLYMRDQRWVVRFRREARMMASLDHPHIVPIYDISEEQGRLYLAMKYIDGPDLAELIAEKGRLPWERVLEIVGQIASALDYAHQRNIIHRDIKPANILISNGQAMLTDFGLAQIVSSNSQSTSVSGGVTGTYNYIAPEVFNDEAVTPASDVYALGCVLYEMLTGQMLVDGTTPAAVMMTHVKGVALDEPLPADMPPGTREILASALAKNPVNRYSSAGELTRNLKHLTNESTIEPAAVPAVQPSQSQPPPPPTKSADKGALPGWVWWAGALIGLIILVLGIRAVFFSGGPVVTEVVEVTRIVVETGKDGATVEAESVVEIVAVETEVPVKTPSPMPTVDPNFPPSDPSLGSEWLRPRDNMTMVYVPAGSFFMGSEEGVDDEKPVHEVTLDGFWIDQTEVNNDQFGQFVSDTGYETTGEKGGSGWIAVGDSWEYSEGVDWQRPQGPDSDLTGLDSHPVVLVSWEDADAYCAWSGSALPSEAQWEYAARGPESLNYPWGQEYDSGKVNFCDQNCPFYWKDKNVDDGFPQTAPVGSYNDGASWIGALDMAGNVWEWINDWYDDSYYDNSPQNNPRGAENGDWKVLRGGSWYNNHPILLRGSSRHGLDSDPDLRSGDIGFRCALPSLETSKPLVTTEAEIPTPTPIPIAESDSNPPPTDPTLGSIWQRSKDKMDMVYVPAGSFLMGSEDGRDDEKPVHEVTLDGFWIDRTEVSNEQFGQFVSDTGHETTAEKEGSGWIVVGESWEYAEGADWQHPQGPDSDLSNMEDHPVVLVSWQDADTYCDWAGGRLPSEAQWEYTARGPQSLIYPWGATFDGEKANFCDQNCVLEWKDESINDSFAQTAAVGSYQDGASWAGALDMAGNVGDWVSDWYGESYYTSSPQGNPEGPDDGDFKVVRGGSWGLNSFYLRGAYRARGDGGLGDRSGDIGFRCALPGE